METGRNRKLSIALLVFNCLALCLSIGCLVMQIVGDRMGSIVSTSNTLLKSTITQIQASCPSTASYGYAENKLTVLQTQFSVANVGIILGILTAVTALFFTVGLYGKTCNPPWPRYCNYQFFKIRAILYCLLAVTTLFCATFCGYLASPYLYLSTLTCSSVSAADFKSGLLIGCLIGGVGTICGIVALIIIMLVQVEQQNKNQENAKTNEVKNGSDVRPNQTQMNPLNDPQAEENIGFEMMENPLSTSKNRAINESQNKQGDIEMSNLQEKMLQKSEQKKPEYGPLKIDPYEDAQGAPSNKASVARRAKLQTNAMKKQQKQQEQLAEADERKAQQKPNPFMNSGATPQKRKLQALPNKKSPSQSNQANQPSPRNQPQATKSPTNRRQGTPNNQQQTTPQNQTPVEKKKKTHPKLQSSYKNYRYVEEVENPQFFIAVPSVTQRFVPLMTKKSSVDPAVEQQDITISLMNELNKINFQEGNQGNNTLEGVPENNTIGQVDSMDIGGVSQVLPNRQGVGRNY